MEYKTRLKYPHLGQDEAAIWTRYIEAHPDAFEDVEYDVLVGEGVQMAPGEEEALRKDVEYLTKKKIDVVGKKGANIYVIEIRRRAGLDIVGKVVAYRELYRAIAPADKRIIGVLITDSQMPDVTSLCQKFGILYFVV